MSTKNLIMGMVIVATMMAAEVTQGAIYTFDRDAVSGSRTPPGGDDDWFNDSGEWTKVMSGSGMQSDGELGWIKGTRENGIFVANDGVWVGANWVAPAGEVVSKITFKASWYGAGGGGASNTNPGLSMSVWGGVAAADETMLRRLSTNFHTWGSTPTPGGGEVITIDNPLVTGLKAIQVRAWENALGANTTIQGGTFYGEVTRVEIETTLVPEPASSCVLVALVSSLMALRLFSRCSVH